MRRKTLGCWFAAMAISGYWAPAVAAADAERESDFKFRFVGPKVGNRIAAVA